MSSDVCDLLGLLLWLILLSTGSGHRRLQESGGDADTAGLGWGRRVSSTPCAGLLFPTLFFPGEDALENLTWAEQSASQELTTKMCLNHHKYFNHSYHTKPTLKH